MTKNQFKRLFFVMLIPLFGIGWWCAENDIFFDGKYFIECSNKDNPHCYSLRMSSKKFGRYRSENGGVYLGHNVRLIDGFHEKVVSMGSNEMEVRDGELKLKRVVGAGDIINIDIASKEGAWNWSESRPFPIIGRCDFGRVINNNGEFSGMFAMSCLGNLYDHRKPYDHFKFIDSATGNKYLNLMVVTDEIKKENMTLEKVIFAISFLTPLVIFMAISALLLLIKKLIFYVRFGSGER